MARARTYKVLVQESPNCIEVAHYINENIRAINRAGLRLKMEKLAAGDLDPEHIDALRRIGITRLPALVGGPKPIVGRDNIIGELRRRTSSVEMTGRLGLGGGGGIGAATDGSLGDFWMREMFSGRDKDGKLVPAKVDDDDDGGIGDVRNEIEKKLRDYESAGMPAHRRPVEEMYGRLQQPSGGGGGSTTAMQQQPAYEDNIAFDCGRCGRDPCACGTTQSTPQLARPTAGGGGDIDSMMMAAWIDNNYQ